MAVETSRRLTVGLDDKPPPRVDWGASSGSRRVGTTPAVSPRGTWTAPGVMSVSGAASRGGIFATVGSVEAAGDSPGFRDSGLLPESREDQLRAALGEGEDDPAGGEKVEGPGVPLGA